MDVAFTPEWTVTDLESYLLPHTQVGSPRTEKDLFQMDQGCFNHLHILLYLIHAELVMNMF